MVIENCDGHMTRNDDDEAEEEVLAVITYRLH